MSPFAPPSSLADPDGLDQFHMPALSGHANYAMSLLYNRFLTPRPDSAVSFAYNSLKKNWHDTFSLCDAQARKAVDKRLPSSRQGGRVAVRAWQADYDHLVFITLIQLLATDILATGDRLPRESKIRQALQQQYTLLMLMHHSSALLRQAQSRREPLHFIPDFEVDQRAEMVKYYYERLPALREFEKTLESVDPKLGCYFEANAQEFEKGLQQLEGADSEDMITKWLTGSADIGRSGGAGKDSGYHNKASRG